MSIAINPETNEAWTREDVRDHFFAIFRFGNWVNHKSALDESRSNCHFNTFLDECLHELEEFCLDSFRVMAVEHLLATNPEYKHLNYSESCSAEDDWLRGLIYSAIAE